MSPLDPKRTRSPEVEGAKITIGEKCESSFTLGDRTEAAPEGTFAFQYGRRRDGSDECRRSALSHPACARHCSIRARRPDGCCGPPDRTVVIGAAQSAGGRRKSPG